MDPSRGRSGPGPGWTDDNIPQPGQNCAENLAPCGHSLSLGWPVPCGLCLIARGGCKRRQNCRVPILPRTLRKGGIPRSRPCWDLADMPQISMSNMILGAQRFSQWHVQAIFEEWIIRQAAIRKSKQQHSPTCYSPDSPKKQKRGVPSLPRTLRKDGIPRSCRSSDLADTPQISQSVFSFCSWDPREGPEPAQRSH